MGSAGQAIRTSQSQVRPPLLYSIAHNAPGSFLDITIGGNAIFGGVSCCTPTPGFDLASRLGSPLANQIAQHLHH
jgi:hypothetical protein